MENLALNMVSLKIDTDLQKRVLQIAEARHQTADLVLSEAIEAFVVREEKREQFKQDAIVAWEHYQATGLHVTQAEMEAWMDQLEFDESAPPPECHR